jgi:hypothetical protein
MEDIFLLLLLLLDNVLLLNEDDCLTIVPCKSKITHPVCPGRGDASRSKKLMLLLDIV